MNQPGASSADFYDALWARSRRVDQHHKCRIRAIQKMMTLTPEPAGRPRRILEPGCGSGLISVVLTKYGEIVGLDQSEVGITTARATVKGRFHLGGLPDLDISDEGFDVCVLSQVIEHFADRDQDRLLRNIFDKVQPGGHLIVTTPNRSVSERMRFRSGELQPIENWLVPAKLQALLETTGWKPLRTIYAFSFFPVAMSHNWPRPLRFFIYDILRLRKPLEGLLETRPFGDCTVVLAERPVADSTA